MSHDGHTYAVLRKLLSQSVDTRLCHWSCLESLLRLSDHACQSGHFFLVLLHLDHCFLQLFLLADSSLLQLTHPSGQSLTLTGQARGRQHLLLAGQDGC